MTRNDSLRVSALKQLKSGDPTERCSAVESLLNENLTDALVEDICKMLEDNDKGVRNSVDLMLSVNPSPQIPEYLVKYVSSPNISTRNLAGEILLKIGRSSVKTMLDYIYLGSNDDKKFLVDILGLIGDPKAAPDILELLRINKNDNVIMACIEALGNLGYEDALDFMILLYDKNDLYKPTIIESLGKIGTSKALDFILLKYHGEDNLTKFSMIESLGLIGDQESFYFLIAELNNAEGPLMWPIIESIFLLKTKYNLDIPFDEKMKNLILQTIEEADSKYRKTAVRLIVDFEGIDITQACMNVFGEDYETDEIISHRMSENPKRFFEIMIDLLKNGCENLKSLLEFSLRLIHEDEFKYHDCLTELQIRSLTDSLINCLNNPYEEVRSLSIELLFILDTENALLFIDKMIEDDNLWNKLKLLEILSGINNNAAEEAIVKLAGDKEEMISECANFYLGQRPDVQLESKPEDII